MRRRCDENCQIIWLQQKLKKEKADEIDDELNGIGRGGRQKRGIDLLILKRNGKKKDLLNIFIKNEQCRNNQ